MANGNEIQAQITALTESIAFYDSEITTAREEYTSAKNRLDAAPDGLKKKFTSRVLRAKKNVQRLAAEKDVLVARKAELTEKLSAESGEKAREEALNRRLGAVQAYSDARTALAMYHEQCISFARVALDAKTLKKFEALDASAQIENAVSVFEEYMPPSRDGEAFELLIKGMTTREVAEKMGLPIGAVFWFAKNHPDLRQVKGASVQGIGARNGSVFAERGEDEPESAVLAPSETELMPVLQASIEEQLARKAIRDQEAESA